MKIPNLALLYTFVIVGCGNEANQKGQVHNIQKVISQVRDSSLRGTVYHDAINFDVTNCRRSERPTDAWEEMAFIDDSDFVMVSRVCCFGAIPNSFASIQLRKGNYTLNKNSLKLDFDNEMVTNIKNENQEYEKIEQVNNKYLTDTFRVIRCPNGIYFKSGHGLISSWGPDKSGVKDFKQKIGILFWNKLFPK